MPVTQYHMCNKRSWCMVVGIDKKAPSVRIRRNQKSAKRLSISTPTALLENQPCDQLYVMHSAVQCMHVTFDIVGASTRLTPPDSYKKGLAMFSLVAVRSTCMLH